MDCCGWDDGKAGAEPRQCGLFFGQTGDVWFEEIAAQGAGDAQEQLRVDAVTVENLVDVGAVAPELLREPHHRLLLRLQLVLDKFANIYCRHKK